MNQFFSFDRFSLLVSKHWADNKKRYLLSVLAFAGLLITWFAFTTLVDEGDTLSADLQLSTYFFSLFIAGTLYASQYYSELGSKPKGSNFLLVPASTFEKFLCSLLYTVVLFFIVFTAVFYVIDFLMVAITNSLYGNDVTHKKETVVNVFDTAFLSFNSNYSLNFLLFYFSIQAIFLFGSVLFRKYNYIKTIIAGFVAWFILFGLTYFLYHQVYLKGEFVDDVVELPNWFALLICIALYVIAPLFWIVTYFRLKAKQL